MATHSSILAWRIPMDRGTWRATVLREHVCGFLKFHKEAHGRATSSGLSKSQAQTLNGISRIVCVSGILLSKEDYCIF